jgi:hypothetical protein
MVELVKEESNKVEETTEQVLGKLWYSYDDDDDDDYDRR